MSEDERKKLHHNTNGEAEGDAVDEPTSSDIQHDDDTSDEHVNMDDERDTIPEKHVNMDDEFPDEEDDKDAAEPLPTSEQALHPQGVHHRFWHWIRTHKKFSIPLLILIILGILAAIPMTRFAIAGTFWKQNYMLTVVDSQNHQPISSVTVTLAGKTTKTDNHGRATLHVKVGSSQLTVAKKYYQTTQQNVTVPLFAKKTNQITVNVKATGRQVPISVTNKITGKPIENAIISAAGTEVKTNAQGIATMVLPADKATVSAQLSGANYNGTTATIQVTESVDKANSLQLTPSGKLYFLSNLSGNIDVVKTNLDGTARQTVLAGTGKEDKINTVMLASQDWKYTALLSKRDGGDHAKLFLINTSNDALTTMDEGDADFTPIGWSGHYFIYKVYRSGYQYWQPNFEALKSYDADNGKIASLDQNSAGGSSAGYFYEDYTSTYILNNEIVYAKSLESDSGFAGSQYQASLNSIKPDGSNKHALKVWTNAANNTVWSGSIYINLTPYGANGVYAASSSFDPSHLYEYEDGQFKAVDGKTASDLYDQYSQYNTYLFSPSNDQTFWSESRDGKNTLFVGDDDGQNAKQIATLSDYDTYGWYSSNYLLVSKNSSELYIMPVSGGPALKITDYYKPNFNSSGYGKGYGGF